jgi:leucine dehydrogenase
MKRSRRAPVTVTCTDAPPDPIGGRARIGPPSVVPAADQTCRGRDAPARRIGGWRLESRSRLGPVSFEELIQGWDGEELVMHHDEPTSSWMLVGVHSTAIGPAMGGARLKSYARPAEALDDVLRLSDAMTWKQAAADLPYGGGKAVLAVGAVPGPGTDERRSLLLRYADLVESLRGTYVTAADMNTGEADMDVIGERTSHVLGRTIANGGSGDPGADTARGVFHGIEATVRHVFGTEDLVARTILVQGLGSVGSRLVEHLREAGATVLVADLDGARAATVADEMGATVVAPGDVIGTPCDVFAPCATGKVLTEATIPQLRCRIVAGAANNQLGVAEDGERLRDAGILYAPDFVINAGGVIHLAGYETLGWDEATMAKRLEAIGDTLLGVYEAAERDGISTAAAADRMARARVDAAGGWTPS